MRRVGWVLGVALISCSPTTDPRPLPIARLATSITMALAGEDVTFDGSGSSDPLGEPLSFGWRIAARPPGGSGQLQVLPDGFASFRADAPGRWQLAMSVTAGDRVSLEAMATVQSRGLVGPLIADISPAQQEGTTRDTFGLDGSGSRDPAGEDLSFDWQVTAQPDGSSPTLVLGFPPSFARLAVDRAGRYEVTLTLRAGSRSSTDLASVTVISNNRPPVANAGSARSYTSGSFAVLDGTGSSDPDADPLTSDWRLLSGPAPVVFLDATSATPTFAATTPGDYQFELRVTDREGAFDLDETTITILPPTDAGTRFDGGCDVFGAGDVYLVGRVAEGNCNGTALAHWSSPNLPSFGLECGSVTAGVRPTDGRLLYVSRGLLHGFRCDAFPSDGSNPTANDPVIATPCPVGEQLRRTFISPEGTVEHTCNLSPTALRDGDGGFIVDVSPDAPQALGAGGWVLTQSTVQRLATVNALSNLPPRDWLTIRWKGPDGFWLVAKDDFLQPLRRELWMIETTGVARLVGVYPLLPVSVEGAASPRLDADGRLFELGVVRNGGTDVDVIVRREIGGTSDIVYSEAANPLVKVSSSSLLTGP